MKPSRLTKRTTSTMWLLGLVAFWSSGAAFAAGNDPGKILLDACSGGATLGERMICNITNASMMASHATWDRLAVFLPNIFGLIFAVEMLKLIWKMDPTTFLKDMSSLLARSICGLLIITGAASYTNFMDLYTTVESAALSLVSDVQAQAFGKSGSSGGTAQMASITGIILGLPDSLYGGMTLTTQTANEDKKAVLMDCPDFSTPTGLNVLESYFKDYQALGTARMRCLSSELVSHGFDSDKPESGIFVKKVAELSGRSTATGGAASLRYGSSTKTELEAIINAPNYTKTPVKIRRQIEDTLFLWNNLDQVLNEACGYQGCADPTPGSFMAKAKDKVKNAGGALMDPFGFIISSLSKQLSAFKANFLLLAFSYLNCIPYYLLTLCAWAILILLTVSYFALAVLPAVTIPFVLVFYTAWWVASPIQGQIQTLISVYKNKIIKYALGPAVVVLLVNVGLALLQGVVAVFTNAGGN